MDTNMLDKLQSTAVILTDPQTILSLTSGNPLTQLHSPFQHFAVVFYGFLALVLLFSGK